MWFRLRVHLRHYELQSAFPAMLIFFNTQIFVLNLPAYANWPTFPQLWVEGELIGGCDIILEMYQAGELQTLLSEVAAKHQA